MNLKKKFNDVLFLVGTLFLVLFGEGFNYGFSSVISILVLIGGFSLFILYRYFMKIKPLELAMHGLLAFTAFFNFIVTVVSMIDFGGYYVLHSFSRLILIFGLCAVYFFYYFFDEKKESEKTVKAKPEAPAKEEKAEQPATQQATPEEAKEDASALDSEIKELNSQYAKGELTTEEYDKKMNELKN